MVKSRGKTWLLTGLIVAVAVITLGAVACGGGSDASGPEDTVQGLFSAMEAKDVDAFFALIDPQGLADMEEQGFSAEAQKAMYEGSLTYDSMKFEGVKFTTELSEDGQSAVVTVVEGVRTMVEDGEEIVEDAKDSEEPLLYYLVLRDGKWYLDVGMM